MGVADDPGLIARRLHDGPVQDLTAALLFLESAAMELDEAAAPLAAADLARAGTSLRSAVEGLRALMGELDPR